MKIDVCLVTKNNITSINGIEHIPLNNLIVETSSPLALARMRAIQKVTTEFFAFIDDDVKIDENWFSTIAQYTKNKDVGVAQGMLLIKGLGKKYDSAMNDLERNIHNLNLGDRGLTHNTLIRTELVKDWMPDSNLSAYEDYDLTQHILKKGYKWIAVPTNSYHIKTWKKVWKNASWGIAGRKKLFPSTKSSLFQIIRHIIWALRIGLSLSIPWRAKIYKIYFSIACIWGHIKTISPNKADVI